MRKLLLSSVAALIVLTGCNEDPKPAVDTKKVEKKQKKVVKEVKNIKTETVSAEDSIVNSSKTNYLTSESSEIANTQSRDIISVDSQINYSTIYFSFDKFNISSDVQNKLSKDIAAAKALEKSYHIKLEGNCDEWGSDEYNFALGLKRASSVKKALIAEGVNAKNISMVSFGESNPSCSDKTQECWSKNRRVDFKILP